MIRKAENSDIKALSKLLLQVEEVHRKGRPDIFKNGGIKYTDCELCEILKCNETPVFVYENDKGEVTGYAFCIIKENKGSPLLTDIKTLYIDDLCVDECERGNGVGTALYEYVREYAREIGCYNLTLNVWSLNESAMRFYKKLGLSEQKIGMEQIL